MAFEKFEIGNAEIEADINGDGDTVILLPGLGGDTTRLDICIPFLVNAGFRTVAINQRGIGGSSGTLENLTLKQVALDVGGVIEALEAAPAHVLGNAYGELVARCLAHERPDLVKTVIIVGAGGFVKPDEETEAAFQKLRKLDIKSEEWTKTAAFVMLSPASDTKVLDLLFKYRWPEAQVAQFATVSQIEECWSAGIAPILVLQGMDDRLTPPENGHILKERIGDRVQVVDLPQAGHALLQEKPETVSKIVTEFLRKHRR